MTRSVVRILLPALLFAFTLPVPAGAEQFEAVSRPSSDITLAFVRPGRVTEILGKEGDLVAKGTVIARQEDEAERIQLEMLAVQAGDETKIRLSEAELEQKKKDLARLEKAQRDNAATAWEAEHALLDMVRAELELRKARLDHEQDRRKHREAAIQLQRMQVVAPLAGRLEEITIEKGESVQAHDPVIRLVQTDPLLVDVPVPVTVAGRLQAGQPAWVNFPPLEGSNEPTRLQGEIAHIATVAEAASNTLRVRVNVGNEARRPAGERITVSFDAAGN